MVSGIYAIVCKDIKIEEVYVGSTNNLERRIYEHKSACNNNNNFKVYQFIRDNGGFDNFKFIVLEHYKGEEEDLRQLERLWYETFPKELLLNTIYPKITKQEYKEYQQEYYKENKEKLNEYQKDYQKEYREENKQYQQEYREENKEKLNEYQKEYRDQHKEENKQYKKEYYKKNKEEISEKTPCPKCLKSLNKSSISRHLKTCPNNHDV